jgi:dynein heavy chain
MVLSNKKIEYDPPIEELARDSDRQSVRNSVMGWIEDYMQICNLFKGQRMDLQQGDYLTEIRDSFEVRGMMSKITSNLDLIEEDCVKYIKNFEHFSDLWKFDPDEHFEKFLDDEEKKMDDFAKEMAKDDLSESEVVGDIGSLQENSALLKGAKARIPPLELFDEIITELENKRREIQQMRDTMNIGWLRIIVSSLRDSLKIKVQKWIDVYTSFLLNQVKVILTNL